MANVIKQAALARHCKYAWQSSSRAAPKTIGNACSQSRHTEVPNRLSSGCQPFLGGYIPERKCMFSACYRCILSHMQKPTRIIFLLFCCWGFSVRTAVAMKWSLALLSHQPAWQAFMNRWQRQLGWDTGSLVEIHMLHVSNIRFRWRTLPAESKTR
jgi:hypothetical protein